MADQSEITVIGRDTRIKGEMEFEGGARILGSFEGKISANGQVEIAESASCKAEVQAERIVVDGTVEGNLDARDRLSLNANAKIHGDITAGELVVTEGATFVGHCSVGPRAAEITEAKPTQAARLSTAGSKSSIKPVITASSDDFTPPWRQNSESSEETTLAATGTDD